MKPISLDHSFRFPPDHRFTPDRIATEYRMLIRGYLQHADQLFANDPKAQEIRDCATRIHELTTALSAHELRKHFNPEREKVDERIAVAVEQTQASTQTKNVSRETAEAQTSELAALKEFPEKFKAALDGEKETD